MIHPMPASLLLFRCDGRGSTLSMSLSSPEHTEKERKGKEMGSTAIASTCLNANGSGAPYFLRTNLSVLNYPIPDLT